MKEYMVHIWGGAFNENANPSLKNDFNIDEGYYYFDTEEKNKFISIISQDKYSKQGLARDVKYGEMTHKRTIFVGDMKYKDKVFTIHYDFGYEYTEENALFQFLENSYSCDCNRSLFIQNEYGEDAIEELDCGEEIELLNYHVEYLD